MGKPGAKKLDQVLSVTPGDVHIIMIPSPGGPVPTPIPHPVTSIIKDKVAKKVKVMGQPGAVKGSVSQHTPPHIPQGGPFQKPPSNKGKIFTASSNVFYENKEAAMLGDTAEMCSDPKDTPVGKVIGTAAMVLIGGGGQGSDAARASASAAAMKAAAAACHRWINQNMEGGAMSEQAHRDVCEASGHPVDVATGKMFTRNVELKLSGRIPFEFARNWSSARRVRGVLGWNWRHNYDIALVIQPEFIAHQDHNGRLVSFPHLEVGEEVRSNQGNLSLVRQKDKLLVIDGNEQTQTFAYDGTLNAGSLPIDSIEDSYGNRILFEYRNGLLAQITDSAERKITLEYTGSGLLASLNLWDPISGETRPIRQYRYSPEEDLVEVSDEMGDSFHYVYQDHYLVQETDRIGFSFYFEFDRDGRCVKTWGDGGIFYRDLRYDLEKQKTWVIDSQGETTIYEWNDWGTVETEWDACGNEWSFQFDENQNRTGIMDPDGNSWTYSYDDTGRLISRIDPEGGEVALELDEFGMNVGWKDSAGNEWVRERDDAGRMVALVDPEGNRQEFTWSDKGDLLTTINAIGEVTSYSYDKVGNLVHRVAANGAGFDRVYSPEGWLLSESDSLGLRMEAEYDKKGRVVRELRRDKGEFRFKHDGEGNVVEKLEPTGRQIQFEYGSFNQILGRVEKAPEGDLITRYEYDLENRLTRKIYPGGETQEFSYREDGKISRQKGVDDRIIELNRNDAGYVVESIRPGGAIRTSEVDGLGRELKIQGDREVDFDFSPGGALLSADTEGGLVSKSFDALGRVVEEIGSIIPVAHEYDAIGRVTKTTLADDFDITYGYENGGVRIQVVGAHCALERDVFGRDTKVQFSNGWSETYHYEGDLKPYEVKRPEGSRRYSCGAGRVIEKIESPDGRAWSYGRDGHGRLVNATRSSAEGSKSYRFNYDDAGNRLVDGREFKFSRGNTLVTADGREFSYNTWGHRQNGTLEGAELKFEFGVSGRLLASKQGAVETTYDYDAFGRRIRKRVGSKETTFGWDRNRLVYEASEGVERFYIYLPASIQPVMICERKGERHTAYFVVSDHRSCPERVLDNAAETVWACDWSPFGEKLDETGSFEQPLGLPGQYHDRETGLAYNLFRYYDPSLTCYLSPDPLMQALESRPYAYPDDPISKTDPFGLSSDDYTPKSPTPHRVVEIDGVKYVEFYAMDAYCYNDHVSDGGNGTTDCFVSIGPNGEVVIQEGKHRG
ncbi:MAG: hypothetical protein HKN21_15595, partial [Candidatus Eisenbacteria bacterium]|nr:hypothetical protein [Candidatus Eisenbacteria bacterium]